MGFKHVEAPMISRQSAHEVGKVVSPTHRPSLPPKQDPWYSFLLQAVSTLGLYSGRKNEVNDPSGIEPATLRLVAQCLNQLRHRVRNTNDAELNMRVRHKRIPCFTHFCINAPCQL